MKKCNRSSGMFNDCSFYQGGFCLDKENCSVQLLKMCHDAQMQSMDALDKIDELCKVLEGLGWDEDMVRGYGLVKDNMGRWQLLG